MHPTLRNLLFANLVFFTGISSLLAQCQSVTLTTQAQVDAFPDTCITLSGSLTISGNQITNIHKLSNVQRVGELAILNTNLISLEGLGSLTKVVGRLLISNNNMLTSFDGLNGLTETGSFTAQNNPVLADIGALENLTKTISPNPGDFSHGNISFISNNFLSSLSGLENVRFIDGRLEIISMHSLLSLNGLNGLDSVRLSVQVSTNDNLQNLTGLDNLKRAERIQVISNFSLISLEGLSGIEYVSEGMEFLGNPLLATIGNLGAPAHVGKRFRIADSPLLASLAGLNLTGVFGGSSTALGLGLELVNLGIKNLHGLESFKTMEGDIVISFNDSLQNLNGLDSLPFIQGHLFIKDNKNLTSIEAIANLQHISGWLQISTNVKLTECSVKSICEYLFLPGDLVVIFANGSGCNTELQVKSNCSPVTFADIIDANLEIDDSVSTSGDIRLLPPARLLNLHKPRAAVATDGVSTVLLKLQVTESGTMNFTNGNGLEFPWGHASHSINGKHYIFFLYTPPDTFDNSQDIFLYGNASNAFTQDFNYDFTSNQGVRSNHITITHVRPPVILMHGTYSDPDMAWKTAAPPYLSLYDRLVNDGFKVFTVNYQKSNGSPDLFNDISSFAENTKVLWGDVYPENTQGIKDALNYYRNNLGVASTQVDVVGHSLGGVLPRVYASEQYNPEYKRSENFLEGDINRLITIGSTHFGSDLGEYNVFLAGLTPFDLGLMDWLGVTGFRLVKDWVGGAPATKAVHDQVPPPAGISLGLIGATEIPAHAITLRAPKGALKDAHFDPSNSYYNMYWYATTLMYQVQDVRELYLDTKLSQLDMGLEAPTTLLGEDPGTLYPLYSKVMLWKSMIEDAIDRVGAVTAALDGNFELPTDIEIYKYAAAETGMSNYADPLIDIFVAGADPVGVAVDYFFPDIQFPSVASIIQDQLKVNEGTMEALRSVMFDNDDNDGVVRVQSQSGELEKVCPSCVTSLDSILHGFAPRYPEVQDKVLDLLTGGLNNFFEPGFPAVDHAQKMYYPPQSLAVFKGGVSGGEAICNSGIAPSHARAFAHIADQQQVIFITRPVNPDATELITKGAATKGMAVKPKSSNWGPQKGYLPIKQRYSKIWKVFTGAERDKKIAKYDSLAHKDLEEGVAVARNLSVKICNDYYNVFIDENRIGGPNDANAEDEVVLVPVKDPTVVCTWGSEFSSDEIITACEPISGEYQLVPLQVMASPDFVENDGVTPRFITADYDLLMVGFYEGEDLGEPTPPNVPFRPVVGACTPDQETLLDILNAEVAKTGYNGGKVVHHGPENQFNESPYIDYPLTVFAPDNIPNGLFNTATDGLVLSIEMGPPGFRDLYLKQFVNRMRREGYDLYHNPPAPGWQWTWNENAEGFQLEDSKNLPDYVEQLPKNKCDKTGGKINGSCPLPTDDSNEKPGTAPKGNLAGIDDIRFSISPTIVNIEQIRIDINSPHVEEISWAIINALGNIQLQGKLAEGQSAIHVDVTKLGPGLYSIVAPSFGRIGNFMKM